MFNNYNEIILKVFNDSPKIIINIGLIFDSCK